MKKFLLLIIIFIACACADDGQVYICTGEYSKCYHRTSRCDGLDNCGGEIEKVSIDEAKRMHRRECRLCYKKKKRIYERRN